MTLVCAHRGLSAKEPENTLAAFRAAADAGFDAIELDVRLTHDGHVVVMHDANIARTTDGVGRVADFDFEELRTHETADGLVPTLDETLDALADWKGTWNIEIKAWKAAPQVVAALHARDLSDRAIVTAMDPRALSPEFPCGLITLGPPDEDDFAAVTEAKGQWVMVDHAFITPELVASCRDAGLKMGAWTVNEPDPAEALVQAGVSMVITDTDQVLHALRRRP